MRVSDKTARNYYLTEAAENNWSVRTLERNINTMYYQRLLFSQNKETIEKEAENKPNEIFDFIKNPTVLEFLNLPTSYSYTEAELEKSTY
jgi:predicted nuclease of restriction endonuclease-like (RecB) superfamily